MDVNKYKTCKELGKGTYGTVSLLKLQDGSQSKN